MLLIENDGPAIRSTNYWQSEHGEQGRWPGRYRRVASLPDLTPWVEQ